MKSTTESWLSKGVSIRATKSSRYSLTPWKSRRVRAGRTERVRGGRRIWMGQDKGDRNPIETSLRLGNEASEVAITSGAMYPELGMSRKARDSIRVAEKTNLGNDRNGMPDKMNVLRRGADPTKNDSGMTGTDTLNELDELR